MVFNASITVLPVTKIVSESAPSFSRLSFALFSWGKMKIRKLSGKSPVHLFRDMAAIY